MKDEAIDKVLSKKLSSEVHLGEVSPCSKLLRKSGWTFRKKKYLGMEYCSNATFCGKYGITQIKKYIGAIPERFITLTDVKSTDSCDIGVAGYAYDYVLENLVNKPERFRGVLSKYQCVGEPDLSAKIGDPLAVAVANSLRSHNTAFYLQEHGCKIIPTMKWSTPDSYEVCFDGYEKGGIVMVSTIGTMRDERSKMYFRTGFKEMLRRISPDSVIIYGDCNEEIKGLIPVQLDIHYFEHERFNRMRKYGK